jgi:hypothetical protein
VLREMDRLDVRFVRRFDEAETEVWWEESRLAVAV